MEHHHDNNAHHDNDQHDDAAHSAALAELLDLDAEVLESYLLDVTTWIWDHAAELSCLRVLDLGAGTGNGTIALAQRFGGAEVIALDKSEEMLQRVRAKALDLGLADRVHTLQSDLDVAWPAIEAVDVVWAANSLHEVADPDRVFKDVFAAIRPGGLLAVLELDSLPRFLPDDIGLGRPGLESRCYRALEQHQSDSGPRLGPDWGPPLERSGFAVLAKRTFTIDLASPPPGATGRYARAYLSRIRHVLDGRMDSDDLAALDQVLAADGPASVLQRNDLVVRGARTAWVARRP